MEVGGRKVGKGGSCKEPQPLNLVMLYSMKDWHKENEFGIILFNL